MFKPLFAGLAATTLALSAQAVTPVVVPPAITVASYSMVDSAPHYGAYHDNSYNGNRDSNGLLTGGTGDLTDGVTTASVAAGYGAWAPYVLWDGPSPVITFDLGARQALSSVTTYFKYYPQAAVYMPGSLGLRLSDDGVHFSGVQLRTLSDAERTPGSNDSDGVFQVLNAPASARFVELTLNQGPEGRWLALGEVSFAGTPSPVPEPASAILAMLGLAGLGGLRAVRSRRV